jgi:hypothetical protein
MEGKFEIRNSKFEANSNSQIRTGYAPFPLDFRIWGLFGLPRRGPRQVGVSNFEFGIYRAALVSALLLLPIATKAVEPWEQVLSSMPLPQGVAELNITNCVPMMLAGLQSNVVVKGIVFMPGATDEFCFFRRAQARLTNPAPTMLDAVEALRNQTRIQASFHPPLVLLHTAEDSLEPKIEAQNEAMIAKLKAARFVNHAVYNDRDWDAIQPMLRKSLGVEILPAKYSSDSWHFYRHSFAGWNLNGWEALQAVLLAGKTKCRIEKQGGLSLRRTVIVFEQDRRSGGNGG